MKIITVRIPMALYSQLAVVALRERKTVESVSRAMFAAGTQALKASLSDDLLIQDAGKEMRVLHVFTQVPVLRLDALTQVDLTNIKVNTATPSLVFVEPTSKALLALTLNKSDLVLSIVRYIVQIGLTIDEYRDCAPDGIYKVCPDGSRVRLTLF